MLSSSFRSLACLSVGLLSISSVVAQPATPPKFNWDAIKFVYAFGDSYSFVQGTRGFANFR